MNRSLPIVVFILLTSNYRKKLKNKCFSCLYKNQNQNEEIFLKRNSISLQLLVNSAKDSLIYTAIKKITQHYKKQLVLKRQTSETIQMENIPSKVLENRKFSNLESILTCRLQYCLSDEQIQKMLLSLNLSKNDRKLQKQPQKDNDKFVYDTYDYKFSLQSISMQEYKLLEENFKDFYQYWVDNPNSLIAKIYGVFVLYVDDLKKNSYLVLRECISKTSKYNFLNVYKLKGSNTKKKIKEGELIPYFLIKELGDMDFLNQEAYLEIEEEYKQPLLQQIQADVKFLQELKLQDYSMALFKVERRDTGQRLQQQSQNLKEIKYSGCNVELREIYWDLGIIDFFSTKNELTSRKYAKQFNDFFKKIIKCNVEE